MDFTETEEQAQLRELMRDFLAECSPEAEVRRAMETDSGLDPQLWQRLAGEVGITGIAVPEELGGAGMGFAELAVVAEELGASLSCVPFLSTCVLATNALLLACGESAEKARSEWLPAIAAGDLVATAAVADRAEVWDPAEIDTAAVEVDDGWRLTGTKRFVLDGHAAGLILVAARTSAGLGLFAVEAGAPGLTVTPRSTMDQTRRFADVELSEVAARAVDTDIDDWLATLYGRVLAALAAEQVGGARACLDMAVQYAATRYQFGRPIGSFQAIKHKCADVLIELESARSAAGYAIWCAAQDDPDLPLAAAMAKATCSDAYFHAAAENIQIHGGIGFTWELAAHLYFKRAKSSELWLGDPRRQRRRIAALLKA